MFGLFLLSISFFNTFSFIFTDYSRPNNKEMPVKLNDMRMMMIMMNTVGGNVVPRPNFGVVLMEIGELLVGCFGFTAL